MSDRLALYRFVNRLNELGADTDVLEDESVIENAFKFLPLAARYLSGPTALPASERLDALQDEWTRLCNLVGLSTKSNLYRK